MPARIRVPSWAVWEVAVFVLNVLAFILVGFQLQAIVTRLDQVTLGGYAVVAAAVCAMTMLVRLAWVTGTAALSRWRGRAYRAGAPAGNDAVALSPRAAMVVGWCGMRGIITLATALALPTGAEGGPAFPYRDLILVTAFGVVLGTLVLQGLTLRPLMLRLRLEDDGTVEREVRYARLESLQAAVAAAAASPDTETAALIRHSYRLQLRLAEEATDHAGADGATPEGAAPVGDGDKRDADAAVVRAVTEAQRQRLLALRDTDTIGDTAFQRVEEEIDRVELGWAQLLRVGQRADGEA